MKPSNILIVQARVIQTIWSGKAAMEQDNDLALDGETFFPEILICSAKIPGLPEHPTMNTIHLAKIVLSADAPTCPSAARQTRAIKGELMMHFNFDYMVLPFMNYGVDWRILLLASFACAGLPQVAWNADATSVERSEPGGKNIMFPPICLLQHNNLCTQR